MAKKPTVGARSTSAGTRPSPTGLGRYPSPAPTTERGASASGPTGYPNGRPKTPTPPRYDQTEEDLGPRNNRFDDPDQAFPPDPAGNRQAHPEWRLDPRHSKKPPGWTPNNPFGDPIPFPQQHPAAQLRHEPDDGTRWDDFTSPQTPRNRWNQGRTSYDEWFDTVNPLGLRGHPPAPDTGMHLSPTAQRVGPSRNTDPGRGGGSHGGTQRSRTQPITSANKPTPAQGLGPGRTPPRPTGPPKAPKPKPTRGR